MEKDENECKIEVVDYVCIRLCPKCYWMTLKVYSNGDRKCKCGYTTNFICK